MGSDDQVSLGSTHPDAAGVATEGHRAGHSADDVGTAGPCGSESAQHPSGSSVGDERQGSKPAGRVAEDRGSEEETAQASATPHHEEQQQPQHTGEASAGGESGTEQQRQGEQAAVQEAAPGQGGEQQQLQSEGDAEALARAEDLKRAGNELFGKGLWDEAAAKYNDALDAAPASAAKEQAIYFANLAACNIKSQQYAVAVQNCTEALQLDAAYQKAFMRRCEAFERLDELDHALSDAKKLLEVAPDSAWAKAKVAALQPVVDARTEKLKTEMMSKLKDLGNTILGKFGLSTDNFKFDKDPSTGSYNIKFER